MCNYNNLKLKAKDNLKVAEYSEKKEYYDVSISRYYYYLYQNIIVYLGNNYHDFTVPDGENTHRYTLDFLIKRIKEDKLKFHEFRTCSVIQKLRTSRRKADYDNIKVLNERHFNSVFKDNFILVEKLLKDKSIISE